MLSDFEEVLIYYRLNDEKLFKWLDAKVKIINMFMKLVFRQKLSRMLSKSTFHIE